MSDNLKAMQECGLLPEGEIPTNPVEMFVDHQELKERLEEYTSRILASQQAAHEAELREKLADREAAFEARTIDFNSAYNANIAYAEQVRELKRENAELRKLLEESKVPEVRGKLCTYCGFRPSCPTRNDDGGLCDDYVAQPKEPKQ